MLMSRLRASLTPYRCLVTAAHHHITPTSGFFHGDKPSYCAEKAKLVNQQRSSTRHWRQCLEFKSDKVHTSINKEHQGCVDQVSIQASPTHCWLPRDIFKGRLPKRLFYNERREISAYLKRGLLPLTQNQSSAGYCTVSPEVEYPLPPRTKVGYTFTIDLSPSDQEKLRTLAYQELKAVLKDNKIKYKKAQKKKIESKCKPLDEVAAHDLTTGTITPDMQAPIVLKMTLENIFQHCDTKDIFKIDSKEDRVKKLILEIENKSKNLKFVIPDYYTAHDIASAVKTLLRIFPVRLMTTEKVDEYPDTSGASEEIQRKVLNLFILSMSQPHRDTLHQLLRVLYRVVQCDEKENNLAAIFGPILFKMAPELSAKEEAAKKTQVTELTHMLIKFNKRHFYVEQHLLDQLRASGVDGKYSASTNTLGRNALKLTSASLLVTAPSMPKTSLDFEITPNTKAFQIVDAYRDVCMKDGSVPSTTWRNCLYEVGGTLDERCLDPLAYVIDVHLVNPTAEFIIRPSAVKTKSSFQSSG